MIYQERAVTFVCQEERLVGVLTLPEKPLGRGVVITVGGPQYRVGSHRQFLLLARQLAEAGVPVLRYDYRGMGDSEGKPRAFEAIEHDLRAAIDLFYRELPILTEVVVWGLCDAASAALMYAFQDSRVAALALANPWVRTPEGLANTMVKHYYGARLTRPEFWQKLVSGKINFAPALSGLLNNLRKRSAKGPQLEASCAFPERMAAGLEKFRGRVLFLISGRDLTALEFQEAVKSSPHWQRALRRPQVEWRRLEEATHTFSADIWRTQVGRWTIEWVKSW